MKGVDDVVNFGPFKQMAGVELFNVGSGSKTTDARQFVFALHGFVCMFGNGARDKVRFV